MGAYADFSELPFLSIAAQSLPGGGRPHMSYSLNS